MDHPPGIAVESDGNEVIITCYSNFLGNITIKRINEPLATENVGEGSGACVVADACNDDHFRNSGDVDSESDSPIYPTEDRTAEERAEILKTTQHMPTPHTQPLTSTPLQQDLEKPLLQPESSPQPTIQSPQIQLQQKQMPESQFPSTQIPSKLLASHEEPCQEPTTQPKLTQPSGTQVHPALASPTAHSPTATRQTTVASHHLADDPFVNSEEYENDSDADFYYMGPRASQAQAPLSPSASPPRSDRSWSPRKHPREEDVAGGERETVTEQGVSGKRVRFTDDVQPTDIIVAEPDDARSPWVVVEGGPLKPASRWGATLTRVSAEAAVLIGGERDATGGQPGGLLGDVHTLKDGVWNTGLVSCNIPMPNCSLSQPRAWHSATRVGERVFIFGGEVAKGEDDRLQLSDVVVLDLQYGVFVDTPLVSAITPSPRAGHSACLLGDSISIFVGFGIGAGRWCRDYWLLCTETLTWMKLKPKSTSSRPPARAYATTTTVAGEIFVFGGNDNNKSLNDIIIGRVQKKKNGSGASITWREPLVLGNVAPAPRTGHCATVSADGNLLVYGGWDDLGAQRLFFSDVWEFVRVSEVEYRWRKIHSGAPGNPTTQPGARSGAAMCESGDDTPPIVTSGFRGFGQLCDSFALDLAKCRPRGAT